VPHVGGARAVDDARYQISVFGLSVRAVQIEDDQVGALPRLDRSDLRFEPQRARPAQRRQLERMRGRQRIRAEPRLLNQGGQPHLGERIESIVAWRSVRADAYPTTGR
jgi:hypothetical protein